MKNIEIIAHRGESHFAPENTLAAINLAWKNGADAVEVDVHLSKDGQIVAIHDPTTERTGNKSLHVCHTDSTILCKLDVGSYKGPEFSNQRIPLLKEILTNLPLGRRLFIDIKCGPEIITELQNILTKTDKISQIVIIGNNLKTISKIKSSIPKVRVFWLLKRRLFFSYKRNIISKALKYRVDGIDAHYSGITCNFIKNTRAAGLNLYAWTIDDIHQTETLLEWGIDGITTNRSGFLRNQIKSELTI